jgi:hypothetical protein
VRTAAAGVAATLLLGGAVVARRYLTDESA